MYTGMNVNQTLFFFLTAKRISAENIRKGSTNYWVQGKGGFKFTATLNSYQWLRLINCEYESNPLHCDEHYVSRSENTA